MAGLSSNLTDSGHLDWWRTKLSRMDERTFALTRYGPRILDVLAARPSGRVDATSLKDLGTQLGVPLKFVPRAVASVTRLGIVTAELQMPRIHLALHRDRLDRRKVGLNLVRRRISAAERKALMAQSNHCCACCGERFSPRELVIDHLVPLSLLGADEPANWVAMSRGHNATKWDRFLRGGIQFYRMEKVRQPFGVRFIGGVFWPVINGTVRYARPAT